MVRERDVARYTVSTMKLFARVFLLVLILLPFGVFAQTFEHREEVVSIQEVVSDEEGDFGMHDYVFEVQTQYGEVYSVDTSESLLGGLSHELGVGDEIIVEIVESADGTVAYYKDVPRVNALIIAAIIFVIITLAVGLLRGFRSILGLGVTVAILFLWVFPAILGGADPVITTVLGSLLILGINMHLSHGLKRQTFLAFLSASAGLGLVILFTYLFVEIGNLTGLATEEQTLLFWEIGTIQLPVGLLMAGIILGAVGVLDDIAITQNEIVEELLKANPYVDRKDLFKRAMSVGRHHIASTVNTLVLVYAGAALPLLLLFMHFSGSWEVFLQNEVVAEEIMRTLAGTCALVLTVPISTFFATLQPKVLDTPKQSS